jgi:pimeloyl-ACP methyl ester carboxylesterase
MRRMRRPIPLCYHDHLFDAQLVRTLSHACYGGADLAECLVTARGIPEKDTERWFCAWMQLADRVRLAGDRSQLEGHRVSARGCFLRASNYYRNAYIFLFGPTPDPRLRQAYDLHRQCFRQAAGLMDGRVEEVRIPYERTTLRGYFFSDDGARPTMILNGGYDSTAEECYFWNAAAALERGYHCLLFDGPGQGSTLIEEGLPFRPDWESVISPVVDWLLKRPEVDAQRIGITGLSFGGYLALRAATGEPRLAACVADPGEFSLLDILKARLPASLARNLPSLDGFRGRVLRTMMRRRLNHPTGGWALRRGLWVHQASGIEEYLRQIADYSLAGRAERIRCPTLVCFAEDDDVAVTARKVYEMLQCEKEFVHFRSSEGAGEHCEAGARLLFHQRAFDWLDARLRPRI